MTTYLCLLCDKVTDNPACAECDAFVDNLLLARWYALAAVKSMTHAQKQKKSNKAARASALLAGRKKNK